MRTGGDRWDHLLPHCITPARLQDRGNFILPVEAVVLPSTRVSEATPGQATAPCSSAWAFAALLWLPSPAAPLSPLPWLSVYPCFL